MIGPASGGLHARVLQVITHVSLGGAERIAFDLALGLVEEWEPAVFAVQGVGGDAVGQSMQRELVVGQVPLSTGSFFPLKYGGLAAASIRAAGVARRLAPTLVHLHTEIPEATWALATWLHPSLRAIPLIRTIHNSCYWHAWPRLGRWTERQLATSHVIAVSESALHAYRQFRISAGTNLPTPTSEIIYNGVAPRDGAKRPEQPPGGPLKILFAGRLEIQKGADLIPSILAACPPPTSQRYELTIIGQGTCVRQLRRLCDDAPAGWSVVLSPPIADLAAQLCRYDLVIMPSRFEGLPLLAIEALLQRIPVVATVAPGAREAFPESYPWLAPPNDAAAFAAVLRTTLQTREKWPVATRHAAQWARERFDRNQMLRAYADAYRRAKAPRSLTANSKRQA